MTGPASSRRGGYLALTIETYVKPDPENILLNRCNTALILLKQSIPLTNIPIATLLPQHGKCYRRRTTQSPGGAAEYRIEEQENGRSRIQHCQCPHKTAYYHWSWHQSGKYRQLAEDRGWEADWSVIVGGSDCQRKGTSIGALYLCSVF